MALQLFQQLSMTERTERSDFALACILTFVAGATNAGGYLAVKVYTSHMSGILAGMADYLVLGELGLVFAGLGALLSFMLGAASTAVLVNWAQREQLHSAFALPLGLEAILLLVFGLVGGVLQTQHVAAISATVMLLCYLMGLQNALITKISHARIRTTHVTGMVTDIGIELGKLMYWNRQSPGAPKGKVRANRAHLRTLMQLVGLFFGGGVIGAFGFKHLGFVFTLPLAAGVGMISVPPMLRDVKERLQRKTG